MSAIDLPFDPNDDPPEVDPDEVSDEERATIAAHAHYHLCRQAQDLMSTSAYMAQLAGVDLPTLAAVELRALEDETAEDDEFGEGTDDEAFEETKIVDAD